ncbi:hypothetical protein BKA62DRAFT_766816 [Auriculariales sp. MPI-PUGE-AT-0066]|nr:hypothetical protein BKA62DRAFT_766816 [Auriculariales sp. MPI-PUGE-AT-0066]
MRIDDYGRGTKRPSTSALAVIGSALLLTASLTWLLAVRTAPPPETAPFMEMSRFTAWRSLPWEEQNQRRIQQLQDCLQAKNCLKRQAQVVLLAGFHFTDATNGATSGENIWANSVLDSLEDLGYTYLYADTREDIQPLYSNFTDQTIAVISFAAWIPECMQDPGCIKSQDNPKGVPLWKFLAFEFWKGANHPLGHDWTLSPEDYEDGNNYLGYSVQRACFKYPYIPHEQRKRRALILAKRLTYFHKPTYPWRLVDYAHPPSYASKELGAGFHFVSAIGNDTSWGWDDVPVEERPEDPQVPAGIQSLTDGRNLQREQWYAELADARMMIGVGQPWLSPSPWDALCLGVPFLNPVSTWDPKNPENRTAWATQHDGLRYETEPRVYHVFEVEDMAVRTKMFWEAVARAASTPLERYISPRRTPEAVRERLHRILETDWRTKSIQVRDEHRAQGKGITDFVL